MTDEEINHAANSIKNLLASFAEAQFPSVPTGLIELGGMVFVSALVHSRGGSIDEAVEQFREILQHTYRSGPAH